MHSLDAVVDRLNELKIEAGAPSFSDIALAVERVRRRRGLTQFEARTARTTIYTMFQMGRRRLDAQLVNDVVLALDGSPDEARALMHTVGRIQQADRRAQVAVARTQIPDFGPLVGRDEELTALSHLREGSAVAICGLGGMGKSHLAFAAVQRWVDRAGVVEVVCVDLRGNNAELPPVAAVAAQLALLRSVGVRGDPNDAAKRTQQLADALEQQRIAVVLDDAANAQQVLEILPQGLGRARVLVTSRSRIDLFGVEELVLDPLPEDDALDLLMDALPEGSLLTDPIAARSLIESVSAIPLGVRVLGARMDTSPEWTLADHASRIAMRLANHQLESSIAAAIDSAYVRMDPSSQRALRQFAAQPLSTVAVDDVSALWGMDEDEARCAAEELEGASLLQDRGGRLSLHDVVRAYALDRSWDEDPESARMAALDRLADRLVQTAWRAHASLHVGEGCMYTSSEVGVEALEPAEGRRWFAAEGDNLLTLAAVVEERRPDVIVELSGALQTWLRDTYRSADAVWLHTRAAALADASDPLAVARAKIALGYSLASRHEFAAAHRCLGEMVPIARNSGDFWVYIGVLEAIGASYAFARQFDRAAKYAEEVIEVAREAGRPHTEAVGLRNVGNCYIALGQLERAAEVVRESLAIARRENYPGIEMTDLCLIAELLLRSSTHEEAIHVADEVLAVAEAFVIAGGSRAYCTFAQGYARIIRCTAFAGLGRHDEAREELKLAREIAKAIDNAELLLGIEEASALVAQ